MNDEIGITIAVFLEDAFSRMLKEDERVYAITNLKKEYLIVYDVLDWRYTKTMKSWP